MDSTASASGQEGLIRELYAEGDPYFEAILREAEAAQKSIWVESYIFEADRWGLDLLKALGKAAQRGLDVRLMVDGVGAFPHLHYLQTRCEKLGIEFKIYHPVPFRSLITSVLGYLFLARSLPVFARINRRNHRKVILIDERRAFVGGRNISALHSESISGAIAWRDLSFLIEGPEVGTLHQAYLQAWDGLLKRIAKKQTRPSKYSRILTNHNRRAKRSLHARIDFLLRTSQDRIYIISPYFVPPRKTLARLREAAKRGVDVQIIVPKVSDVPLVQWASINYFGPLIRAGARVFEYGPRMLHTKAMLIDQTALAGSSNLNYRSFLHDLEVQLVCRETLLVDGIENIWQVDLKHSTEYTYRMWRERPLWRRFLSRLVFLFRYWM